MTTNYVKQCIAKNHFNLMLELLYTVERYEDIIVARAQTSRVSTRKKADAYYQDCLTSYMEDKANEFVTDDLVTEAARAMREMKELKCGTTLLIADGELILRPELPSNICVGIRLHD